MKKIILILLALIVNIGFVTAQNNAPEWVNGKAYNDLNYIGIGSALKSEDGYRELAMERALRSLASQIQVTVAAESVLMTLEEEDVISSTFSEKIQVNTSEHLERYRLIDQWSNETEYWVYYELNRFDYEEYMQLRINKAISAALDYLAKGDQAMDEGLLATAISAYTKGFEALELVLNEDLTCSYKGREINIGTELYHSLVKVWDGVTVGINPNSIEVEHMQSKSTPVAVGCYKNGTPLKQIDLEAKFISGSGDLSKIKPTNSNGTSLLYVNNVTSKQAAQQVKIGVVFEYDAPSDSWSTMLLKNIELPYTMLNIGMSTDKCTAYISAENMELPTLEKSIATMVSSKYFDLVNSPNQADVIMKVSSTFEIGREVKGDLYNTREYLGGVSVEVINNRTSKTLTSYDIPEAKTLLQLSKTQTQGKSAVSREIIKKMNREFPMFLSKIEVDRTGDIPQVEVAPTTTPTQEPIIAPVPAAPEEPVASTPSKKEIKGLLDTDVWAIYDGFEHLNDKTIIHLTLLNNRNAEYDVRYGINSKVKVYNQAGTIVKVHSSNVGNSVNRYDISLTLVSGVPTKLDLVVDKLESISLLQIGSMKLRALK